ncbi:hypothetical protein HAX54_051304 [Datura stramonium]|uniref:Uncharacterized protein n=1 Tax=Datura stramonium TaxID=4076 RepID=A0ABS8SYC8_DATST|nr:hypothetical protein [Datura stramonium]
MHPPTPTASRIGSPKSVAGTGVERERKRRPEVRERGIKVHQDWIRLSVSLPPIPLKEPVSEGSNASNSGFSPYSERVNGRIAMLGLSGIAVSGTRNR